MSFCKETYFLSCSKEKSLGFVTRFLQLATHYRLMGNQKRGGARRRWQNCQKPHFQEQLKDARDAAALVRARAKQLSWPWYLRAGLCAMLD